MKNLFQLLILVLILSSVSASAQLTKSDIDKAIDIESLKHPYLYFTEEEKPELLSRIKNDQECNNIYRKLEAEAQMWLHMPVDKNIPVQGKNTRAGWSDDDKEGKYAAYYKLNKDNAFYLAFLYQMTGEQKYADKAFEFADAFCDLTTWTKREHEFPIIYSRIMPWNVDDDQVNFNFDHWNGDAAREMAAVYDWLYPALNKAQRDRIRGALIEKAVTRVRGDYEFHWWATAYRCNWCGVCNSGVGLTGLALLTENPQLTDIVAESYNRINNMLNELGEDGGWQEGGGYWHYAVRTSAFFADALKRLSKGKYNLFENKKLKSNPVNFPIYLSLTGDKSINFEDWSGSRLIGSSFFINKIAIETKSKEAVWYRSLLGEGTDIFDIIWDKPDFEGAAPKQASKHFRTLDWWVMRSDFESPEKVVVAGKAGMNDDPHHGHLDIGQFIVYWQNEYFIKDGGRKGWYDEKYFDNMRWDYPTASSVGHNVVLVNGEKQISAKMYKEPWKDGIGGDVEEFSTTKDLDYVRMNPTKAYPNKELKEWKRHVVLEKPNVTVAFDEISSDEGAKIEVRYHPDVDFEVNDDFVFLKGEKGNMAVFAVTDEKVEIIQGKHAAQYINVTKEFFWIPYFDFEVISKSDNTKIATIILPVKNKEEAQQIVSSKAIKTDKSGNITLSFAANGNEYNYEFENRKGGLALKN